MKILDVQQGSQAWLAARAQHNTASEAPAVMGASKYLTRNDLMRQKATGITPEVDSHKQALFDRGHETESAARGLLEQDIGSDLYPITAVCEETGLLASVDGISEDDSTLFEHKLWSESLAAQVRAGELEPHYYWQLEQELLVTKAEKVIFVTSDGTRERRASMEYRPVPGRREALIAAWKQFDIDLAAYVPSAPAAIVVATPVTALPAVSVQVTGTIVIHENFDAFEVAARDFIEHRLIREPKSDQNFADLEVQIKAMKGAEAALESAEAGWIAQIDPVSAAKRRKDMLLKLMRDNRLMAEKLLASEKERRKGDIVAGGIAAIRKHIDALNERLGKAYMPAVPADFAGAIKGKSSLAKMEDAVATTLATAKIEANRIADGIDKNLGWLRENARDFSALFPDTGNIVLKAHDDLVALAQNRITAHQQAEAAKEEAQREKIRAEERAKAEKEAQEKVAAEQRAAQEVEDALIASFHEGARRIEHDSVPYIQKAIGTYESVAKDWENDSRPRVVAAFLAGRAYLKERLEVAQARQQAEAAKPAQAPAPAPTAAPGVVAQAPAANAPTVVPIRPAAESTATIRLGQIAELLGFTLTADFLATLGFHVVATEKGAKFYRDADVDLICEALIAHIRTVQAKRLQAA